MRNIFFSICLAVSLTALGQVKWPQVRVLENQGWSVQHSVMSWDSLSIYFSARAPQKSSYDLYVMHADGWKWGAPQRMDALSTDADELWPSVSSDERMLFYVVSGVDPAIISQIWRAWHRDGNWTEAAPLIISSSEDSKPQIAEDNQSLVFERREQTKKNDGPWHLFAATMMDDHNWTLPMQVQAAPASSPIIAMSGTIVAKKSGKPIGTGKVLVYNAMNEQLLQTASIHPMTGRWRVALQSGQHYRLALTAEGYSYHYMDVVTDDLKAREERSAGIIALDDKLSLTLTTYDAETQEILDTRREVLALGKHHTIRLRHTGYDDYVLEVNTARPTVFTETELDIALQPQKSMHHFVVTDARTDEPVADPALRMNGQPIAADTALRLNKELMLQVSSPGYLFFDTLMTTGNTPADRTIPIRMVPIVKDLVLQLRNIQFEYDSYELTESSNDELEALAQLLFMNPTLRIELSSHTDDQGSDRYNDRLSSLRGKAVESWLLERGVPADRMVTVGYGKRKPLVENDSEEHRALNRRVEIKVLDF